MFKRFLSLFGFVAHLGDLITSPFRLSAPGNKLRAGTARAPGSLIVGVVLGLAALGLLGAGNYSAANKEPTNYSVTQLVQHVSRDGKDYARITGQLYDEYVDRTSSGSYQACYLLGESSADGTNHWIVVRSGLTETSMSALVAANGTVTLTGMLTDDSSAVSDVERTLGGQTPTGVDGSVVLNEGSAPPSAELFYGAAVAGGAIAFLLIPSWLITLLVGYVAFKAAGSRQTLLSTPGSGMMPVRVTGLISGYRNGKRARELRAELRVPPADPAAGEPPIDLVWQSSRNGPTGIRLTPGVTRIVMGRAYPVTGSRPAIKVRFGRFDLIVGFDSELARDAAFDQIRRSAGLTPSPDGASASIPA